MSRYIALFRHREIVGFALVDDVDFSALNEHRWTLKWRPKKTQYAIRYVSGRPRYMHREISGIAGADHVNGDGLDNRRSNLRAATLAENTRNRRRPSSNTSGYKGVYWHKGGRKWASEIVAAGKRYHLGLFDDPAEAHQAYCEAAKRLHGEFARTA